MIFLKYKHPFRGYGHIVFIIALVASYAAIFIGIYDPDSILFLGMALIFIAVHIIAYLIINHPRAEEREKIESARELVWRRMTGKEREQFDASKSVGKGMGLVMLIAPIVISLITLIFSTEKDATVLIIVGVFFVFGVVYIVLLVRQGIWLSADDSIECAEIDVDHIDVVKHHGKHHTYYYNYAVYYTPEGRFMTRLPDSASWKTKLYLARYKNRYSYVLFENESADDRFEREMRSAKRYKR